MKETGMKALTGRKRILAGITLFSMFFWSGESDFSAIFGSTGRNSYLAGICRLCSERRVSSGTGGSGCYQIRRFGDFGVQGASQIFFFLHSCFIPGHWAVSLPFQERQAPLFRLR